MSSPKDAEDPAARTHFVLPPEALQRFVDALEAPLPEPQALKALLTHRAPWERDQT